MLADIGMLQNKNDVKLLVLYVLRAIDRPVSEEQLGDCIMGTGSANYFDYTEAFDELLRFGQVLESDGLYSLTPLGLETIDLLERQLIQSFKLSSCALNLKRIHLLYSAVSSMALQGDRWTNETK